MPRLTVLTESNQRLTASIEAWILAIYKTLTPAQKAKVVAEVEKIDREAIRLKLPTHQVIDAGAGIRIPTIPDPLPIAGRSGRR